MTGFSSQAVGLPASAFAILVGILVPCLAVSLYLSVHRSRILFTGAALWVTVEILRIGMMLNISVGGLPLASATYSIDWAVIGMLVSFMVVMLVAPQVVAASGSVAQGRIVLFCRIQAACFAMAAVASALTGIEPLIAPWVSGWCLINAVLIVAAGLWRASHTHDNQRLIALCWSMGFGLTSMILIVRQEPAFNLITSGDSLWISASVARLLFVACGVLLIGLHGSVQESAQTRASLEGLSAAQPDFQSLATPPLGQKMPVLTPTALGLDVTLNNGRLARQASVPEAPHRNEFMFKSGATRASTDAATRTTTDIAKHIDRAPQTVEALTQQLDAVKTQLSETADLQRQVSSLLSHELRAPLSTISAAAQSLDLILSGSGELVDGRIARIRRSVVRMTELLEAFFSAERTHSGPLSPIYQAVDLSALAANVIAQQQPDASHTLVLDAPTPVIAWCDPSLCAVVLRNLTHNAIKYSPANRPIVVRVRERRSGDLQFGVISVTDQGTGMDAEEMARIFERNYRRASHREVKGTGIGLYLARKLCEHQSGRLEVESTLGTGSSFFVTLPGKRPQDA